MAVYPVYRTFLAANSWPPPGTILSQVLSVIGQAGHANATNCKFFRHETVTTTCERFAIDPTQ
ncbi:MAG TPA: hypothetical protein DCZ13_12400 [Porticoccaceae bacterium]|nr:hypothetical protein [Porticoccaceae bacterium]